MKIRLPAIAASLSAGFLVAAPLFAEPKMPDGFSAAWTDASGLTWRETGSVPLAFSNTVEEVKTSMESQGYALRHDIFDKSIPDHRLFLFLKDGEEITIMLWRIDIGTSGLSWGVTQAADWESPAKGTNPPVPTPVQPSTSISTNTTETTTSP